MLQVSNCNIAQQQYGMLPDMESAVSTRDTLVRRTLLAASPIDGAGVARAAAAGADAVVLDLARGPAAHRRDEARGVLGERIAALARSGGETLLWTDAVGVAEDLAACPPGAIAGVLVTAGSREELDAVDGALGDWESRHGMQRGVVNVEVVLATAAAVQSCATIALAARGWWPSRWTSRRCSALSGRTAARDETLPRTTGARSSWLPGRLAYRRTGPSDRGWARSQRDTPRWVGAWACAGRFALMRTSSHW